MKSPAATDPIHAELPQNLWGKVLSATPIVMTVVATMLAGLASSEMTRAQYDRALAAQLQSKAGDQWNFFQAKKLRSAVQRSTVDMITTTATVRPLDATALTTALDTGAGPSAPNAASAPDAWKILQGGKFPELAAGAPMDPHVAAALAALESSRPEREVSALLVPVSEDVLTQTLQAARDRVLSVDALMAPINQAVDGLEQTVNHRTGREGSAELIRDFTVARLRSTARRYDLEARQNQIIANLYELEVRKSNFSAERHHVRSTRFFYGMLAAQMGVIISTFAMAARKRNLLWSIAAAAGLTAISFAVYVYLYV